MGYAIYKAEDFIATTNIALGYAEFLDRYTGIFITTVSDKVRGKYSYNYKRNEERLKNEMIQFPVDETGSPDWEFMRGFMRHIEAQKLSAVLAHFSQRLHGVCNTLHVKASHSHALPPAEICAPIISASSPSGTTR